MFIDPTHLTIYVKPGATDMRKQSAGLAVLVQNIMGRDPFSGSMYLFCNKRKNIFKALFWETNGFWVFQKRLEKDTFPWPQTEEQALEITERELRLLLEGLDIWNAHKKLSYTTVA